MPGLRAKPVRYKLYRWVFIAAVALLCLMISVVVSRREEPKEVVAEHPVVLSPEKKESVTPALPPEEIPEKPAYARFFPYIQVIDSLIPQLYPVDLPKEVMIAGNSSDDIEVTEPAMPKHRDSGPQPDKRNSLPYRPVEEKKKIFDFNRFAFGIQTGSNHVTNMGGGFEHREEWVSQPDHPRPEEKPERPDDQSIGKNFRQKPLRVEAEEVRKTGRRTIIIAIIFQSLLDCQLVCLSHPGSLWKQVCLIPICIRKSWKKGRRRTVHRNCIT